MTGLLGTYFPGEDPMAPVDLMPRGLLGPSVLGRMQAHSDAQRQRMAAGDYSPTPMNEESMWLADDLAGGLLGSLPGGLMMLGAKGTSKADDIARLLREGRAAEVTDEMLGALGPNDQARLFDLYESGATGMDLPMDADNRMYRASRMGFPVHKMDGLSYHITPNDISSFKLNADPSSHSEGGAVWTRLNPRTNPAAHQVSTAQKVFAEGANDMPLYGRGNELSPMRSHDFELSDAFPYALSMGENQKLREAGYGIYERGNERLVFDPANIRSRHARFDPRLSKNADLLASMAGLGILGATQFYPYIEGVE